jgi:hypothetical protein
VAQAAQPLLEFLLLLFLRLRNSLLLQLPSAAYYGSVCVGVQFTSACLRSPEAGVPGCATRLADRTSRIIMHVMSMHGIHISCIYMHMQQVHAESGAKIIIRANSPAG